MIEDFFDHSCNIYHLIRTSTELGYGLPTTDGFSYPTQPDIEEQACHFGVKSKGVVLVQTDPVRNLEGKTKLTLPAGTDVRINDLIEDIESGLRYIAEKPNNIRGHHVSVLVQRMDDQKGI